jgi:hypothetical protein
LLRVVTPPQWRAWRRTPLLSGSPFQRG